VDLQEYVSWVNLADTHEEFLKLLDKAASLARDKQYMHRRTTEMPGVLHVNSLRRSIQLLNNLLESYLVVEKPKNIPSGESGD
jgi:hypothetical protein